MTRYLSLLAFLATPLAAQVEPIRSPEPPSTQRVTIYTCGAADSVVGPPSSSKPALLDGESVNSSMFSFRLSSTIDEIRRDRSAQVMVEIDAMDQPLPEGAPATLHVIVDVSGSEKGPDSLFYRLPDHSSGALPLSLTPMRSPSRVVAYMSATTVPASVLRQWTRAKRVDLKAGRTEVRIPDRILKGMQSAYRASLCGVAPSGQVGDPSLMPSR